MCKIKLEVKERFIQVWSTVLGRVQRYSLRWGNALRHKLQVRERRSFASNYTLTTALKTLLVTILLL